MKVWLNGKLVNKSQANVNVMDHGLLYGDGVFEGIRVYNGRIFRAEAHLDRLYESAKFIRLAIPYSKQELHEALKETVAANNNAYAYIRLVISRGEGTLGLSPFQCGNPNVFVVYDNVQLYPKEMYEEGMAVIIAKTVRISRRMLNPKVKSLNYLNNILAKIEAIDAGVSEALMLNECGELSEATGDNVFIVKNSHAVTPPLEAGILGGITRGVVCDLCRKMGIELSERAIKPKEIKQADECFLTGTAAEVIPVTKVDDITIGDGKVGPVTAKLIAAYREMVDTDIAE